ncbi:MAG: hypothetical protein WA728_37305, partial [Xanthobacteraceae bacterium]
YKYVTGDPIAVQQRLISDLQSGHPDPTNLDPSVLQAIQQGGFFAPTTQRLKPLKQAKLVKRQRAVDVGVPAITRDDAECLQLI